MTAPVVLVLGMHRSGTSVLAHVVSECGVGLEPYAELQNGDAQNPHGYFEPIHLVRANDALLSVHGGTWYAPPVRALQTPRVPDELLAGMRARVDGWRARGQSWVWKDPRLNATLPAWLPLLPDQLVLLAARNPAEVARSLATRDGVPAHLAYLMWEVNLRAALYNSRGARARAVLRYEDLVARPAETVARIARFLDAHGAVLAAPPRLDVAAVHVAGELRHTALPDAAFLDDPAATAAQKALYQMPPDDLARLDSDPDALWAADERLQAARAELEAGIRAAWDEDHYAREYQRVESTPGADPHRTR